ncbi:CTP synthase C-terminal region-related (seleno)protein [Streptantibioticus cattleyicolor]|uniref:CTP synthase (glutamine hydrolyzing) n=1 Tax=Streptantibioticus cattleyicolor (strain ATCC 35852 / DSM 46488 / JCM 4925 / NBRC 14057 / NRRL 8057) TaxID=1003195 RepID=F8JKJ7_STREN|nr:CTP synthase [Streptantibioticus cattleyicolor]AEW99733.1 CTP synthase [Streptantibioticus cattleyicolor NRRL 8057 = DSM 46488]CCB71226.1 CTP synthase (UTP-ammonia lyase) [Streptantibioticus cattleyicolor NRRL 8057 = DSM 46488]
MTHTARIALVGDRSPHVRSHTRVPVLLDALRERDHLDLDAYWIPTEEATDLAALAAFDAIWVLPGSPYRSEAGALTAVRTAREHRVPLLGTCAGFQHVLLEYARNVCGLTTAAHAENTPETEPEDAVVVPLACSLVGHEGTVDLTAGSLAEQLIGAERSIERYHCNFGASPRHVALLRDHGLRFTGADSAGEVRIAELPGHPFFLATLFQPELAGDGAVPHPIIRGLAAAAVTHATVTA